MEVLLIESDHEINTTLLEELDECGFSVTLTENGTDARQLVSQKPWDLILMDMILPDVNGYELLQYTRFKKNLTPILALSSSNDKDDKIKALDYGADDYLAKPFLLKELIARIHAIVRRAKFHYEESKNVLECDDLKLYADQLSVMKGGKEIKLTSLEFKFLKLLMENKDRMVEHSIILNTIWGNNYEPNSNIIDVCISYLRHKIDPEFPLQRIETVKGGYILHSRANLS